VRLRHGTTAQHATFTGADGEVTFDTTKKCLVAHDGATPGGKAIEGWVKLDAGGPLVLQSIAANKIGLLDLMSWSGADAGVVARYLVEA